MMSDSEPRGQHCLACHLPCNSHTRLQATTVSIVSPAISPATHTLDYRLLQAATQLHYHMLISPAENLSAFDKELGSFGLYTINDSEGV